MAVWDGITEGKLTLDEARDAYLANPEYVFDDVKLLLSNIVADMAVITVKGSKSKARLGTVIRRYPYCGGFHGSRRQRRIPELTSPKHIPSRTFRPPLRIVSSSSDTSETK